MSGYLRTKRGPIKRLDVMSLLTAANPDNSEIQLKTFTTDSRGKNDRGEGRRERQLVLIIRLPRQVHTHTYAQTHVHARA